MPRSRLSMMSGSQDLACVAVSSNPQARQLEEEISLLVSIVRQSDPTLQVRPTTHAHRSRSAAPSA
jgi:hypothetical protein